MEFINNTNGWEFIDCESDVPVIAGPTQYPPGIRDADGNWVDSYIAVSFSTGTVRRKEPIRPNSSTSISEIVGTFEGSELNDEVLALIDAAVEMGLRARFDAERSEYESLAEQMPERFGSDEAHAEWCNSVGVEVIDPRGYGAKYWNGCPEKDGGKTAAAYESAAKRRREIETEEEAQPLPSAPLRDENTAVVRAVVRPETVVPSKSDRVQFREGWFVVQSVDVFDIDYSTPSTRGHQFLGGEGGVGFEAVLVREVAQ